MAGMNRTKPNHTHTTKLAANNSEEYSTHFLNSQIGGDFDKTPDKGSTKQENGVWCACFKHPTSVVVAKVLSG